MITYLCGGINGLSDEDCKNWREDAKAKLVTEHLDPMRRDYRGKEDESFHEIVLGDLDDIVKSDFVLVNATRPSWGTAPESKIKKVKVQSLIDAHLYYTGQISGELYEWSMAGTVVEVDERDVPELLTKRLGKKMCCGSGTNLVFQLA